MRLSFDSYLYHKNFFRFLPAHLEADKVNFRPFTKK